MTLLRRKGRGWGRGMLVGASLLAAACSDSSRGNGAVTPPPASLKTLRSLSVTPSTVSLEVESTVPLEVTATYSDNSTERLTTDVTWASSEPGIATVDGLGFVTGVSTGNTTVRASTNGLMATGSVQVTPATHFTVFDDDFHHGVQFRSFDPHPPPGAAAIWASRITRDTAESHAGNASLRITFADDQWGLLDGAFQSDARHDLSGYSALTFWAKASRAIRLGMVGINSTPSDLSLWVERYDVALTTEWRKFVVPLPRAEAFQSTDGLFHFSVGMDRLGYTVWIDEMMYERDVDTTDSNGVLLSYDVSVTVGGSYEIFECYVEYRVEGEAFTVGVTQPYFDYVSSDEKVATVDAEGMITGVALGKAEVSALWGGRAAVGALTVRVWPPDNP